MRKIINESYKEAINERIKNRKNVWLNFDMKTM